MSDKTLKSFDFKIEGVTYSMIDTSNANIRKNLADYDLSEIPKRICIKALNESKEF